MCEQCATTAIPWFFAIIPFIAAAIKHRFRK